VSLDASAETEQPPSWLEVEDLGLNPEQLYAEKERQRIVFKAMNDLKPRVRKAIELRELDERSSEESAKIMGISVSALKGRMFHGRRKLRERLKHYARSAWTSGRDTSRTTGNTRHVSSQDQVPCNACG